MRCAEHESKSQRHGLGHRRLLSVEKSRKQDTRGNFTDETTKLSVVGEGGDLHTFELDPATSVR